MRKEQNITKEDCKKLALKIKNEFYRPVNTYKTTIFLCGADLNDKDKIRFQIADIIKRDISYKINLDLVYPEDVFEELLYSSKRRDLLSLENMLADSVDVIVIIPESPGSFSELGAFANNPTLREKTICILDQQYKKRKSFINEGPIKLIKKSHKYGLIYFDQSNIYNSMNKLKSYAKKIKKQSNKKTNKISLLQLENFLLPSIFLLEPVGKNFLNRLTFYATNDNKNSYQATLTALSLLIKKRKIESTNEGYKLTDLGLNTFFELKKSSSRIKRHDKTIALDDLRLEILNFKLRNKKLRV